MIITILEIPVVLLSIMTGEKNKTLLRLINNINNLRKKKLNKFSNDNNWVWEMYDGKENPYTFLEKRKLILTLQLITIILMFICSMWLSGLLESGIM